ncbi:hypothetical protein SLS60_001788 [Paraconiothyrium brasiliense]|uniref:Rhodopsin domain-containing protein n=1 Tax=Paraconiothyrium brasiliense TaxID=300254 RepID=A0ABR3S0X8_9PLEO
MKDAITSQKYAYAAQLFLILGIPMPKVSMCLSYLRIFYSDIAGRRLIYGLLVTLALTMISFLIETFFTCSPLSLYWKELRPTDKCLKDISTLYIHGSLNLAVDVALMGILIPRILDLKLNSRQKWMLVAIVLLGSLSVAAGIIRLVRVGTTLGKANSGKSQFDPPWDMYDVSIWTSTEIYVALICAAAPGIKPLVSRLLPKLLGTSLRSRSKTTGGSNAYELGSKMKRSTLGTRHSAVLNSSSTTNLTSVHGPYSKMTKVYSTATHDEESLDGKSDMDERPKRIQTDGIMRNTSVLVKMEQARVVDGTCKTDTCIHG